MQMALETPRPALAASWARLRTERVDIAWLAAFRALFGLTMAMSATRFLAYGWVERLFVEPTFRFRYLGWSWVPVASGPVLHSLFVGLVVLGVAVACGAFYRITAPSLALGLTYFQLLDVSTYLNHYYLAGLLAWLLAASPAARAYSFDAWRHGRRGRSVDPTVSLGVLYLLRLQVGVVYVSAGLAKAQSDWLVHGQPLRIWLSARSNLPILGDLLLLDGTALVMSWAGFLFDSTVVFFLLMKRTRPVAYLVAIGFHVGTSLLFPIGMFPLIMVLAALVFFPPSWPRSVLRGLSRLAKRAGLEARWTATGVGPRAAGRVVPTWLLAVGLSYAAVQVALPLRAFLYPGNVLWHEQGLRFSWRVMVRAKGGQTTFRVTTDEREKPTLVSPRAYLTGLQESEMSSQPDLILQLAHHIHGDFVARGYRDVRVFADSRVALNGRRSQLFIDPNVDLATVEDGLLPVSYVLSAPPGPPPHTRPTH
jgi:vitamin K-dependent gamma-carboxylase